MAVPSARNSGLERTSKRTPGLPFAATISLMDSAVLQGTVDFSTMILSVVETSAIVRTANSTQLMSEAKPAPIPAYFVGVLTLTKTTSASAIAFLTSVVKNRLGERSAEPSRGSLATSKRFGSKIGRSSEFHASIRLWFRSATVTLISGHLFAMTAHVGPPLMMLVIVCCHMLYKHLRHNQHPDSRHS